MPLWAVVLTVISGWIAAVAAVVGMFWHRAQSAKDAGRLEQKVEGVIKEQDLMRAQMGACQTAAACNEKMTALNSRIENAHKRMDRLEDRIGAVAG